MPLRFALLAAVVLATPLAAQETVESPDVGEQETPVTFGGLVQTQLNTSDQDDADAVELVLRRIRLAANARLNDVVSGRIDAELANAAAGGSAELNEAYALFRFSPSVGVLVGKGGRPFGLIDATSAPNLVPIERGSRIRGAETVELYRTLESLAYAGRSVGVQVLGDIEGLPFGVAYAAGYFSGTTAEEGDDADIRQFAARVQVAPVPGIQIGLAATSRVFAEADPPGLDPDGVTTGADPQGETERGGGFAVDVEFGEYGRPGLHVVGEVALGQLDPFRDQDFVGAQGWVAYRAEGFGPSTGGLLVAVEPLLRASVADVDGPLDAFEGVLLTPGLNLYAVRNTRLALNLDLFFPSDDTAETLVAFRSQVQVAF